MAAMANGLYSLTNSLIHSRDIREAILTEIRAKLSILHVFQVIIDNLMPLTVLLVVVKAFAYRNGYLKKDHFDNLYITKHIYAVSHVTICAP